MTIPDSLHCRPAFGSRSIGRWVVVCLAWIGLTTGLVLQLDAQETSERLSLVPYGQRPVDYWAEANRNPVSRWIDRRSAADQTLAWDETTGYLKPLLEGLGIRPSSQLLVFSKTALNQQLISPDRPRAIYFNDSTMVAWVPKAAALEIATWDDDRGFVFLALPQQAPLEGSVLRLRRERRCVACHAGTSTLRIPGLIRRSFETEADGTAVRGFSQIDHTTAFSKRWAGWLVSGTSENGWHGGNVAGQPAESSPLPHSLVREFPTGSSVQPELVREQYPVATSDVVAHLVFDHQVHGLNLISRVLLEHRYDQPRATLSELTGYLMFEDEQPLPKPISGEGLFAQEFQSRRRSAGSSRGLREFDLQRRVFRYPLSYLVTCDPFRALPEDLLRELGKATGQRLQALFRASEPELSLTEFIEVLESESAVIPPPFLDSLLSELTPTLPSSASGR